MEKKQRYRGLQDDYHAQKQQEALRQKYKLAGNAVIKIENPLGSVVRIVLQFCWRFVALAARLALILLACIGLSTLIFPSIRAEFLHEWSRTWSQLMAWL